MAGDRHRERMFSFDVFRSEASAAGLLQQARWRGNLQCPALPVCCCNQGQLLFCISSCYLSGSSWCATCSDECLSFRYIHQLILDSQPRYVAPLHEKPSDKCMTDVTNHRSIEIGVLNTEVVVSTTSQIIRTTLLNQFILTDTYRTKEKPCSRALSKDSSGHKSSTSSLILISLQMYGDRYRSRGAD